MAVRPHGKSATRAGGLALGHGGGGDPLGVSSSGSGSTARSARSSSSDRGDCVFRGKSATTLEGVASAGRCARRRSPERFAGDSPLEGDGFEPSVFRRTNSSRRFYSTFQQRLGSAPSAVGDLNRAIWATISAGTITSATTATASAGDGGRLKTAALLTGDRGFESCSLQRRVSCEPVPGSPGRLLIERGIEWSSFHRKSLTGSTGRRRVSAAGLNRPIRRWALS